jgi:5-methylcytosine-specific restriction endonuclease McrA
VTKLPPLEINHIDGNASNTWEENLEVLCPNCHSLTTNYKNHNKGNGKRKR